MLRNRSTDQMPAALARPETVAGGDEQFWTGTLHSRPWSLTTTTSGPSACPPRSNMT